MLKILKRMLCIGAFLLLFPSAVSAGGIGVRTINGAAEFYRKSSGDAFVPRGNNFIRLNGGHSTFDPGLYDVAGAETALTQMQQSRYNVVRVFLSYSKLGGALTTPGIDPAYAANLADFLVRARRHKIFVIIAFDYWIPANYGSISNAVPPVTNVDGVNTIYMHPGYVTARNTYLADLIVAVKKIDSSLLDVIFSFDWNEPAFYADAKPFSLKSGTVTPAEGGTYDMSNAASRQLAADNTTTFVANQLVSALKAKDSGALITFSVFTPFAVGHQGYNGVQPAPDSRSPFRPSVLLHTGLDYIDIHAYPAGSTYSTSKDMATAEVPAIGKSKPIIMGEMGAYKQPYPNTTAAAYGLRDHQIASCALGFMGWLVWTWDSLEQSVIWTTLDNSGAINGILAPIVRSNPCIKDATQNNAQFVSQSVPLTLTTNQTFPVSIVMKNVGTSTWTHDDDFRLGSQNPQDNGTWGVGRVLVAGGEPVPPGSTKTFTMNIKAPPTPGTYNFQWRMLQETIQWFGDATTNIAIVVSAPTTTTPTPNPNPTAASSSSAASSPAISSSSSSASMSSAAMSSLASSSASSVTSSASWTATSSVAPAKSSSSSPSSFIDVPDRAWYTSYVNRAQEMGFVRGYVNRAGKLTGRFGPGDAITIAEAIKIATVAAGYDSGSVWPDPDYENHWAARYIAVAKNFYFARPLSGNGDIDRVATRAEVASIFAEAFAPVIELPDGRINTDSRYKDVRGKDLGEPFTGYAVSIELLSKDGILTGVLTSSGRPTGYFRPHDSINRAEVVKVAILAHAKYGTPGSDRLPPP